MKYSLSIWLSHGISDKITLDLLVIPSLPLNQLLVARRSNSLVLVAYFVLAVHLVHLVRLVRPALLGQVVAPIEIKWNILILKLGERELWKAYYYQIRFQLNWNENHSLDWIHTIQLQIQPNSILGFLHIWYVYRICHQNCNEYVVKYRNRNKSPA